MNKKLYFLVYPALIACMSCKKNPDLSIPKQSASADHFSRSALANTTYFDWENVQEMPTVPGQNQILPPWAAGTSRLITDEVVHDYKRADGWELVHNTFSTLKTPEKYYFTLYNKYRGILRLYYYLPSGTNLIPSTNIVHTLLTEGNSAAGSPVLNFAATDIVDVNVNQRSATTVEQWQVAPGTWYSFEYELAYDKNLSSKNYTALNFLWPVAANNITKLDINGTLQGTISGNVTIPGSDLTVSPNIDVYKNSQINIKGVSDAEKSITATTPGSKLSMLFKSLKSIAARKLSSVTGGIASNLLSGIFGGKSGTQPDNVNLKMNTKIAMTGSLTSSTLIGRSAFSFPGYDQSNTNGLLPVYNSVPGVYYPALKPVIIETKYLITRRDASGQEIPPKQQFVYTLDYAALSFDINPAVLAIADVRLVSNNIVMADTGDEGTFGFPEKINEANYLLGERVGINDYAGAIIGVRVSFEVTPKDGSPKSVLIKTFTADLKHEVVISPDGEEQF